MLLSRKKHIEGILIRADFDCRSDFHAVIAFCLESTFQFNPFHTVHCDDIHIKLPNINDGSDQKIHVNLYPQIYSLANIGIGFLLLVEISIAPKVDLPS